MARYALSDLHGCYELWYKIKEFLQKEDELYYLGDAIDRQPDGIQIMQELIERPYTIYLKGNHEDMMCGCVPHLLKGRDMPSWTYRNGGEVTWKYLSKNLSEKDILLLIDKINSLPINHEIVNNNGKKIIMCHAGRNPWETYGYLRAIGRGNKLEHPWLWDREHLNQSYPFEYEYKDVYVVFGHTPTPLLNRVTPIAPMIPAYDSRIAKINDGHKIDIDLGSFVTGKAVLFDLDTFYPTYFYSSKYDSAAYF